ncbi:bile acid-coenzyme A ligase [Amycolatopsis sacchari]|uniref:Bile acid-coenzyme A ligase n=1 Tax=Amycolatopsis sacchari TaxID=115433 RepID=A0A1I3RF93_9PSEU|nr:AMP-binding protein [Amycolatopsis sacchari]SFJ43856.1 bile acid-coenzyme A ligase [Amycolatopsis sacchari]
MDVAELQRLLAASPPEPFVRTMARLADEDPDFVSIVCEGDAITRREFERRSNRLARAYAERGAGFGDYVAIALPNGIEFYLAFFAALKVGAVPLPLSYRLPVVERQAILDLAKAALLVGVAEGEHPGYPALPAGFEPDASVSEEPLPEVVSPAWKAPTSGGSTGRPKIIRAGSGAEGSPAINQFFYHYAADDVQAVVAPLYHNSALAASVGGLLLGQRLVVAKKFDAEDVLRLIGEHRVTWVTLVPTMMHRMYRLIEAGGRYDLSSIRVLLHLAAKCPEWLKEQWLELLGPEKVLEIYGGTESISITLITGEEWLAHRGSVGRPWIGDMKVFDPDGNELPPGEVGEIYMKGAEGMGPSYEYVGAEARTIGGWQTLGDLGWKDEDGYLYISDRRVDMIVSGGANIYPAEVENAIDQHPAVLSSVVVGLPDEDLGQRAHAIVQAEPGTTAREVLDFLADRLVRYKIPRSVEFTDQPLRDDSGKVRRSKLRDAAIERMKTRA